MKVISLKELGSIVLNSKGFVSKSGEATVSKVYLIVGLYGE